jgi:hypothetical protein
MNLEDYLRRLHELAEREKKRKENERSDSEIRHQNPFNF